MPGNYNLNNKTTKEGKRLITAFGKNGKIIVAEKKQQGGERKVIKSESFNQSKESLKKVETTERIGKKCRPLVFSARKLSVVRKIERFLGGDPKKIISIGVLNRDLNTIEEVEQHRALLTECPYYSECFEDIIRTNTGSYSCSLCLVFQKHVLVRRKN